MDIESASYTDADETGVVVIDALGTAYSLPWPCQTWHGDSIGTWLDAGNVITPYTPPPPAAEDVKAEAGRRIVARYPEWKQRNMTARGVELLHIQTSEPWTPEEQAEADALQAAWDWIASVRAASDILEAQQPIPADWQGDHHWPA